MFTEGMVGLLVQLVRDSACVFRRDQIGVHGHDSKSLSEKVPSSLRAQERFSSPECEKRSFGLTEVLLFHGVGPVDI